METQFAQHIGIAEHQLGEYVKAIKTFETALRRYAGASSRPAQTHGERIVQEKFEHAASVAQGEAQTLWMELWAQLDQARALAEGRGRDIAAFDEARNASRLLGAGAMFDPGEWQRDPVKRDTAIKTIEWHVAPHALVRQAIDAVRSAMPEVAILEPAASAEIPQLRSSSKGLWVIAALGIAGAVVLVVFVLRAT